MDLKKLLLNNGFKDCYSKSLKYTFLIDETRITLYYNKDCYGKYNFRVIMSKEMQRIRGSIISMQAGLEILNTSIDNEREKMIENILFNLYLIEG